MFLPHDGSHSWERPPAGAETQRDIDTRQAAYFSTSSELGAYDIDAVLELGRKAI